MDVSIRDTGPLFEILDDGDGLITITEFCKGLLQLKGMARALDIIVLQRENAKVLRECRDGMVFSYFFFGGGGGHGGGGSGPLLFCVVFGRCYRLLPLYLWL